MSEMSLFGCDGQFDAQSTSLPEGEVRLRRANRAQTLMAAYDVDELIPLDHRARLMWEALDDFDLSMFTEDARARGSHAGRPLIDPRVLICLWLYATSEGIGSARQLERLVLRDAPYQWICGGMKVSAHTLSDFRVGHPEALDRLFTDLLATLMASDIVRLSRVAIDGTRVRASAGASSFRREPSLEECLKDAEAQVERTREHLDAPLTDDTSKVQRAAQHSVAREKSERVKKALEELEKLRSGTQRNKKPEEVRASTTDPEARVMKHGDGGFRPSYNVQAVVDVDAQILVDVAVTQKGNDYDEIGPALDRIEDRLGRLPDAMLADGGYAKKTEIEDAEARGVEVYAPQSKQRTGDTSKPRWDDGPGVIDWRKRMSDPDTAEIYKQRAASIETCFGDMKEHRTLRQLPTRGVAKALSIVLLNALTYNLVRWFSMASEA